MQEFLCHQIDHLASPSQSYIIHFQQEQCIYMISPKQNESLKLKNEKKKKTPLKKAPLEFLRDLRTVL